MVTPAGISKPYTYGVKAGVPRIALVVVDAAL